MPLFRRPIALTHSLIREKRTPSILDLDVGHADLDVGPADLDVGHAPPRASAAGRNGMARFTLARTSIGLSTWAGDVGG